MPTLRVVARLALLFVSVTVTRAATEITLRISVKFVLDDAANGYRSHVASGRTVFVSTSGSSSGDGSSGAPYATVGQGATAAPSGSILLLQAGLYPQTVVVSKPLTLRATHGTVVLGQN